MLHIYLFYFSNFSLPVLRMCISEECPGGSEYPCHNQGVCNDGIDGNGTCTCYQGYTGDSCDQCQKKDGKVVSCVKPGSTI